MTYFGFLARFLVIPIVLLLLLAWYDRRRGRGLRVAWLGQPAAVVLAVHVVIALIYTTPWDNYLVATRVWWYDPALVTGFTIGWVPIEEYTFFVLQPIFTGLWLLLLGRHLRVPDGPIPDRPSLRRGWLLLSGVLWVLSMTILIIGWQPGTYLGLELAWALPPIMLQILFGADILWHYRRFVLLALVPPTLYLSFADALAIGAGTWTINPEQSLQFYVGGILPLEEIIFFFLTNTLVVFGMTLTLAVASKPRIARVKERLQLASNQARHGSAS